MNRKIWKALGIAVCMLALAAPRAMAKTYKVGTVTKFAEAVQEINKKSSDKINEIFLTQDIILGGNPNEYTLYTLSRGETTIKGGGNKITISNAGITVAKEGTVLNLGANGYDKKLTIDGKTSGGFVSVLEGATANMYENVTLQNWQSAGNACVVIMGSDPVTGSKSVFNMHGGVIEKCSRAVIAQSGATFNMFGGEIRNCGGGRGSGNGGGVRVYEATFVMSDGTISGCSADTGGGLCAEKSSTVTISGGTISGCKALSPDKGNGGGLYVEDSTLTIERGTISGCEANNGGGLYAINSSTNSSTVNISGGTISGCTARNNGGGLYVDGSTITIEDGTISGCTAAIENGGGLYAKNSSKITISGGTISGCSAEIENGGGLYANNSTIEITDGTISGCKGVLGCGLYANNSIINISGGTISGCEGRWGGGLYAEKKSTITITGGTISRCEVGAGGGLFVTGSTLNIEGGTISECTASDTGKGGGLYAENNSILTISGGTIKGNKAAYGGGVALNGSKINSITKWTVVGNKAYKTNTGMGYIGGGIYLENGSMDVSDGSNRIYNNTADGHGADICLDGSSTIRLPNAANMGATFGDSGIYIDGWYNDDNPRYRPSKDGKPVENLQLSGPLSLVASYKADPVRIEIDANGGVGGSGSQTVQKGTNIILEAPTKEGHLFKGWKDEKGKSYPAGEDGKVKITVTGDMTLTAVWEAKSFTVTYVLLDGKTRTETAAYGKTVTLVEEPRTGYTFVGWNDGAKVYHAGETITVTGDMTLTAVWEARTFTVTYVLPDGKTRTETAAYGQNVTLVEEPRTGYTFVGWKDGEKMHQAGETITVTGNVTLTAEWKKLPSAENLPKTGDESPVLLWGAALAVSAAACFVLRRRK